MTIERAFVVARPQVLAFAAGLVFGIGLVVSSLADPFRVLAFLDIAGAWDPTLLLVMGTAVAVGLLAFGIARRRRVTLIGLPLQLPARTDVDRRVLLGGVLFGIGWGLAGVCPGPAFVVLGTGSLQGVVFVAAMLAGMGLFDFIERRAGAAFSVQPDR